MTTPADLLEIAQSIHTAFRDETWRRTCINRAYYAIFHIASEIDERLQLTFPSAEERGRSHEKLYKRLSSCLPSNSTDWLKVKSIGLTAAKLKTYRKTADYKLTDPVPSYLAEEMIAKTTLLIQKAAEI